MRTPALNYAFPLGKVARALRATDEVNYCSFKFATTLPLASQDLIRHPLFCSDDTFPKGKAHVRNRYFLTKAILA